MSYNRPHRDHSRTMASRNIIRIRAAAENSRKIRGLTAQIAYRLSELASPITRDGAANELGELLGFSIIDANGVLMTNPQARKKAKKCMNEFDDGKRPFRLVEVREVVR